MRDCRELANSSLAPTHRNLILTAADAKEVNFGRSISYDPGLDRLFVIHGCRNSLKHTHGFNIGLSHCRQIVLIPSPARTRIVTAMNWLSVSILDSIMKSGESCALDPVSTTTLG